MCIVWYAFRVILFAFILLVFISAVYDIVTIAWHNNRQAGRVGPTVALSVCLEGLAAAPVAVAILSNDWRLLLAGLVGSALGTWIGMVRGVDTKQ